MQTPLDRAADACGGLKALAEAIGVNSVQVVSNWKADGRRIPAEHCPAIERATTGAVRCEELRPDVDWSVLRATPAEPARQEAA
jgi:DNA-binding transcriptional regulator YdaS (Cro superfamily)